MRMRRRYTHSASSGSGSDLEGSIPVPAAAVGWLRQYFDLQSKSVQAALGTLAQQQAVAMPGEIPDLAASLDAVRSLKAVADRTPERAAARAK